MIQIGLLVDDCGEGEVEGAAFALFAFGPHTAVMRLNNMAGNGQTETCSTLAAGTGAV